MCWSDGYRSDNICRSSNYIWFYYFPFSNPCCITATKLGMMIGDFFLLFIKTVTSAIMATPLIIKKKTEIAHFTILWGCGSVGTFVALVNPNLPLKVLSTRFVHSTLKQHCWCQLTLCRCSQWLNFFFCLAAIAFI